MSNQFERLQISAFNSGEQLAAGTERRVIIQYKRALKEIDAELAEAYRKYSKSGKITMADVAKYGRLTNLQKSIAEGAKALGAKQIRITETGLTDIYNDSYMRTGHAAEYGLNKRLSFTGVNVAVIAEAIENPLNLISWKDRTKENIVTLTRQVSDEITNGIIQGHSFTKMSKNIQNRMNIGASKAMRIVRTETHRVQMIATNRAVNKAMRYSDENDLGMEKIWVSTLDTRTRFDHTVVDGQVADDEGFFTVGGVQTQSPGNTGVASLDINCRCGIIMRFEDENPRERSARDPITGKSEVIPYVNYQEWAKERGVKPPRTPKRRVA
jgi:uncharacterized protein with gpF-like domain